MFDLSSSLSDKFLSDKKNIVKKSLFDLAIVEIFPYKSISPTKFI